MDKLVQIVVVAMILVVTAALVMFGYSDNIKIFDSSGDQLVNDTGCKYAQQQLDNGQIDELPDRCETGLEPEPPQISAT